jgi:hypothetical protein
MARVSVALRKWGSVASSVFVTLLGDGVHLILANPPWRQLQERAQKIQGDKKHDRAILSQVIASRSSIKYISHLTAAAKPGKSRYRTYKTHLRLLLHRVQFSALDAPGVAT